MKSDNISFESVEEFNFLGTILYQNSIKEVIKSKVKSGNDCYHSVQNILSSILVSTNLKTKMYRYIILPVDLCGCGTWSLTLREEHWLRVFENRVLRIFEPERDAVTGKMRKIHNEELSELYSLPNIVRVVKSRRMRWAGHVVCMGDREGEQCFGGKT
jgi:hypothetical protein